MDEALLLTTTDRGAANRAWAEIDHDLVDDGALAALTNPIFTTAVSDRVENVQVHPQWGSCSVSCGSSRDAEQPGAG